MSRCASDLRGKSANAKSETANLSENQKAAKCSHQLQRFRRCPWHRRLPPQQHAAEAVASNTDHPSQNCNRALDAGDNARRLDARSAIRSQISLSPRLQCNNSRFVLTLRCRTARTLLPTVMAAPVGNLIRCKVSLRQETKAATRSGKH